MSAAAAKRTAFAAVSIAIVAAVSMAGAAGGSSTVDQASPTPPANVHVISATTSEVRLSWAAARDDVGVVGYYVYLGNDRTSVGGTTHVVTSLGCGKSANASISAYDAAGNESAKVTTTISTAACADRLAPTTPSGFRQVATTQNAVVLAWNASQDDTGVVAYGVYRDGTLIASSPEPNVTVNGLKCDSTYVYSVDAADAAGNRSPLGTAYVRTASCDVTQPAIPTTVSASSPAPGTCPTGQFRSQYFANTTLSGSPAKSGCEAKIDYDWAQGGPGSPVPTDKFSARWIGQINLPAGETVFTVTADDGLRLWVDGVLLLDVWKDQNATAYTARRTLTAGSHEVKLEYYDNLRLAVAKLAWTSAQPAPSPPPSAQPPPPSTQPSPAPPATCPTGQFRSQYYANTTLSGSAVKGECEAKIDYDWAQGSPGSSVPTDKFSARWIGQINLPAGETVFTVTGDDGLRLWVDGALLLDAWKDQAATAYTARRTLAAGSHEVKLEYYENGGLAVAKLAWTSSQPAPAPPPSTQPPPPPPDTCPTDQFRSQYYSNTTLSGSPVKDGCEAKIDYDWAQGSPGASVPTDKFSARWIGQITVPAGETVFTVTGDDGVRLWVDGALLLDAWKEQAATAYTARRTLTAGSHEVKLEYYENWGLAVAKLAWTSAQPAPSPPPSTQPPPTADTTPPTEPRDLAISDANGSSVLLTWSPSTDNQGVTAYGTYKDGSNVGTTPQPGATVSSLACGTAYMFEADARDAAGNRSSRASVIGSTDACSDSRPPSPPASLVATSRTATSIALSWSASSDDVAVTGYGLYRGGVQIATSSTTSGIFSGLTCNTNYTLAVDAYDAAGNRSVKTTVMVATTACSDTTPPSAPTGLAASNVTQTSLNLSWSASSDTVGVTGYDVYRNGTKVATVTSTSSSQTALACGTSYSFAVVARDGAGNNSPQASLQAATSACSAAPLPTRTLPSVITQGGVYSGQATGTVQIRTTAPVVIENSVITNTGTGYVVDANHAGVQLTLRRTTLNGGSGQAIYARGYKSITVENATVNKTWGIRLDAAQAGAAVRITKSKFVNQVFDTATNGNGFWVPHSIQIAESGANHAHLEIDWNEFINEFGQSRVEDVISMWKSSNARIHDNGIRGAYPMALNDSYAGGGIMLGDGGGNNNIAENNILVGTANHCLGILGGSGNILRNNKMVHDSRNDQGQLFAAQSSGGLGIQIWNLYNQAGFANNVAEGNTVGVTKSNGSRNDYWLGTTGNGNDIRNTTLIKPGQTITKADEDAMWQEWKQKVTAAGVVIGA